MTCNAPVLQTEEPQVLYEVFHDVERVPQPVPAISEGGDCFNCAAMAILQHFHRKETGEDFPYSLEDLWEKVWKHENVLGPNTRGPSRMGDREAFFTHLKNILDLDINLMYEIDLPAEYENRFSMGPGTFGPQMYTANALAKRVRVYLEAGYLGYSGQQFKRTDEIYQEGFTPYGGSDHIVVIDGYRYVYTASCQCCGTGPFWSGSYRHEIHVVCSSTKGRDCYWIEAREWVTQHGGYDVMFLRPNPVGKPNPYWPDTVPECPNGHVRER